MPLRDANTQGMKNAANSGIGGAVAVLLMIFVIPQVYEGELTAEVIAISTAALTTVCSYAASFLPKRNYRPQAPKGDGGDGGSKVLNDGQNRTQ